MHGTPAYACYLILLATLGAAPAAAAVTPVVTAKSCILGAVSNARASLPIAEKGAADARASGDKRLEAIYLRCEGYARESIGETMLAAQRYEAAVSAAEASGDREALADALVARGELHHFSGNYGEAIFDLKRSHDLYAALRLGTGISYSLNAMANLYADSNVGEYDKAIAYYRELLAVHEKAGRMAEVATAHFNLGSTLERKGELAAALPYYRRAYEIDKGRGDADSIAEEQRVIGSLLAKQGKAGPALPWIEQALAHFAKVGDPDGFARTRLTRGVALRVSGAPDKALADLDASRAYFLKEENQRFLVRIAEERALALAAMQQWRPAYDALGEQFKFQRDLDRKLAAERTSRLRVQFGAEHTEKLNNALQLENQRRGEALAAAERERELRGQVIVLGVALLLLLAGLALRQVWRLRGLRALALTDELTSLANRRSILAFLDRQSQAARRSRQPLSVISLDIDHFKAINDNHGHDAGDRALKQVATVAGRSLRGTDRFGRVGGEEFLLVLPNTGLTTAVEIAERTRTAIESTVFDDVAPGLQVTVSLGVSTWTGSKVPLEALIKRADEALYHAKDAGRNRVEVA